MWVCQKLSSGVVELLLKIFECNHVSVVNLKVYSNVCLAVNGTRQLTAISSVSQIMSFY